MSPPPPDSADEPAAASDDAGWDGFGALDKLLEHRVRLAICVLISRVDEITFSRLKELLGETDGNLGAHLRKLEDAGYLRVRKAFVKRKPTSWYTLKRAGRDTLRRHVQSLNRILGQPGGDA